MLSSPMCECLVRDMAVTVLTSKSSPFRLTAARHAVAVREMVGIIMGLSATRSTRENDHERCVSMRETHLRAEVFNKVNRPCRHNAVRMPQHDRVSGFGAFRDRRGVGSG